MTDTDRIEHQDPMDLLDEEAIRGLAQRSLERLLSPNPAWLQRHEAAHLASSVPTDSDIESMLENLRATVDTEEGTFLVDLDPKEVRSIGRDLGDAFHEAEERLENLNEDNRQEFLEALEQSVRWSTRQGLVGHPDLEVTRWMEMAEAMDLSMQAREVLMHQGGPEDLGPWWKHARPLEENWGQAFQCFRRIVGGCKYNLAHKWITPLLEAHLPVTGNPPPPLSGQPRRPLATTQYRSDAMDALWANQASLHYGRTRRAGAEERLRLIRRLDEEGAGNMLLLDWEDLMHNEKNGDIPAPPAVVGERLAQLVENHPQAYARWQKVPRSIPNLQKRTPYLDRVVTGRSGMDISIRSISMALQGAGPDDLMDMMNALDTAYRRLETETDYEAQVLTGIMDSTLPKGLAPGTKRRF